MRSPSALFSCTCALLLTASFAIAADDPATPPAAPSAPPAAAAPANPKEEEHTELGDRMSEMNRAFKKLRKQITDATQNASSIILVAKLRQGAEASAKLTPAKAADLPEAERPKFMADFQDGIKKLVTQLDALDAALKANDNALAEKTLKEISAYQRDAHHEFRKAKP